MKRISLMALLFALPGSVVHARIPEPPAELAGIPVALMTDLGSGQVLYARHPDRSFLPASLTKVMTAYVAFEEMAEGRLKPDRVFTVRADTAKAWNGRGTSMYLASGEQVSAHDLLRGIMTASANDAAVVLAQGYTGSVPAWTFLMNDAARRLGMTRSHFGTPNGWPDEGQTRVTARDMITLATAMITRYPQRYHTYSGRKRMTWKQVTLFSHDPATGVVAGADGIKTGYTHEAGYNFLGSAQRDGRRLVMVVAGARSGDERASASRAFLEWGFAQWRKRFLFAKGAQVTQAKVQGGTSGSVPLRTGRAVYAAIPADGSEPIRLRVIYRGPVEAPVARGQKLGELEIRVGPMTPNRVPLYAAHAVAKAGPMDRIVNGFKNLFS